MRPSLRSALWIVVGICTVAGAIGVLVGLVAEWSIIAGALQSGQTFDFVLVVEAALVLLVVMLLVGVTRQRRSP